MYRSLYKIWLVTFERLTREGTRVIHSDKRALFKERHDGLFQVLVYHSGDDTDIIMEQASPIEAGDFYNQLLSRGWFQSRHPASLSEYELWALLQPSSPPPSCQPSSLQEVYQPPTLQADFDRIFGANLSKPRPEE